jgi:hypothetical protein
MAGSAWAHSAAGPQQQQSAWQQSGGFGGSAGFNYHDL